MSRFMNTLGNLGLLAGQLDAAGDKKRASQAAAAEKQRQFNLDLASKYDIANFNQSQANNRSMNQLYGRLGGAMISANNKGSLGLSDMSNLDTMIGDQLRSYSGADGVPLFGDDAYKDNEMLGMYTGPYGQIMGMVKDQVLNTPGMSDDPVAIQRAIGDALSLLSPQVTTTDNWGPDTATLGFGGEVGQLASSMRQKILDTPASQRGQLISDLRSALMGKNISASVANQIIAIATQGI